MHGGDEDGDLHALFFSDLRIRGHAHAAFVEGAFVDGARNGFDGAPIFVSFGVVEVAGAWVEGARELAIAMAVAAVTDGTTVFFVEGFAAFNI